jgi:hypothetical protein
MRGGEYMKYILYGIVAIVAVCVISLGLWAVGVGVGIFTMPLHQISNRVQTGHDVIDTAVNAQNCLTWQDWFRTQEAQVTTLQETVDNAQTALNQFNAKFPDPTKWTDVKNQQYLILSDNLTGAKNEANDAINTYNAKSQQENFAICKNGLPVHIQPF